MEDKFNVWIDGYHLQIQVDNGHLSCAPMMLFDGKTSNLNTSRVWKKGIFITLINDKQYTLDQLREISKENKSNIPISK